MSDLIIKHRDLDMLKIASIKANANSLLEQMKEFDWLKINMEQAQRLDSIETQLNNLVHEIVNQPKYGG